MKKCSKHIKATFAGLILLLSMETMALSPRDTIDIDDLWTKQDTTEQLKKLEQGQEMQVFEQKEKPERRKVRTISREELFGQPQKDSQGRPHYSRFKGHWCGINLGFLNIADVNYAGYGSYGDFMEYDYSQSFTLQANIFEESISLVPRNNFGIVFGLGFEYQHAALDNKQISIRRSTANKIEPYYVPMEWDVKKNYFKNIYLTVPLLLELQLPAQYRKKFYLSGGIVGGIRLHTKTKLVYYNEEGYKKKKKKTDHYNVQPIKADLMATVGYSGLHFWGSYTLTELFRNNKGPEIHLYNIGVGVSF